mmetsp:Transcript_39013/g.112634  ORF Transcript_39013/g.112634 Transcript_39013/m.112634 type:complete len:353 (-) Transcript_39013:646-1704(-)
MGLKQVVEPCRVHLATGLHWLVQALLMELWLVQSVLEMLLAERLYLGSVHRATLGIVMGLKAVLTAMSEGTADHVALLDHLRLVLVQPSVPLHREIEVLGSARVRVAQVVRCVVVTGKGRVVTALYRDNLRLWIIGHLDVKYKGDLACNLRGLAQNHQAIALEGAALDAEALARVHLPEEADLPVLLREHPHAEQIAARNERLIEVMARPPGSLSTCILSNGGINGARVSTLVDPEVHSTGLLMVSVCHDLACLCRAEHSSVNRRLDELLLPARDGDPSPVERVRLGHVARMGTTSWPWEWTTGELQSLVSIVEALAKLNLPLSQLRARVREVVVTKCLVLLCFAEEHCAEI